MKNAKKLLALLLAVVMCVGVIAGCGNKQGNNSAAPSENVSESQPAGDTITLTAAATSDSERLKTFKAALWKQGEGTAVYVEGATLVFTADGELYTGSFSGLDPDAKYKVTISYDSGYYTISGGMSIAGLVEADAAKNE